MARKAGFEYYIGPLYFWRINLSNDRVEIYERPRNTGIENFIDENRFQSMKNFKWSGKERWVSDIVFFKEARAEPFAVKDIGVVQWHKEKGTSHV